MQIQCADDLRAATTENPTTAPELLSRVFTSENQLGHASYHAKRLGPSDDGKVFVGPNARNDHTFTYTDREHDNQRISDSFELIVRECLTRLQHGVNLQIALSEGVTIRQSMVDDVRSIYRMLEVLLNQHLDFAQFEELTRLRTEILARHESLRIVVDSPRSATDNETTSS